MSPPLPINESCVIISICIKSGNPSHNTCYDIIKHKPCNVFGI